ncbi:Hypothetical predicted protein [Paramuricea clavata]|uniref:Uncharacterized protein n=1 Tax=Paramuricea clavata TaxID=317549 RepID=A0A7D9IGY1_PARCT|nr:Hypothetical predicted protein [Paramuricea clavata]
MDNKTVNKGKDCLHNVGYFLKQDLSAIMGRGMKPSRPSPTICQLMKPLELLSIVHGKIHVGRQCYGSGQSLRGWERNRLALSFETRASAKQKSRAGGIVTWDTEVLKEEGNGSEEGRINCGRQKGATGRD